ncbi:MAG TPA: hypothetical protein VHQ66_12750 [Myxococcota bacterium]|nr:hypothetical protein [Myxococcota bacterium]
MRAPARRTGTGWLAGLALVALSLAVAALAAEAALRAFPRLVPPGVYGAGRFDPALGMHVRAGDVLYTRGDVVRKRANDDGFLDAPHALEKPAGTVRVGFFGDSYVEANQVRNEDTFVSRVEALLAPARVETLGFGLSGWGTLQALRAFERHAPRYDLDVAVYVFVENDPGDNALALSAHRHDAAMPYAELADAPPGYRVREASPPPRTPLFTAAKWVQERSLLGQVVWVRWRLLRQEGLRPAARASEREMTERALRKPGARPDPNDLPSSWPEAERAEVLTLAERILADWQRRAAAEGRTLAVLYLPRGHEALRGVLGAEATWYPWLAATCTRLGIPLLDPRGALAARLADGVAVYDDHLTRAGHEALARYLAGALPALLRTRAVDAGH